MRYGPWPRRGRLLRHLCFSSSFPRVSNPGGARSCQGGTHCVQWGGRWRSALTWPRRDYLALLEEEEKRCSNGQRCVSAARGRPQRRFPLHQGGRSGEGARDQPLVPGSTQPGSKRPFDLQRSAATCEGWGARCPRAAHQPTPAPRPAHACATWPRPRHACDRGPPAPRHPWYALMTCAGDQPAVAVLWCAVRPDLDPGARWHYIAKPCKEGRKIADGQMQAE